jgi:hypothetical protein
MNEPAILKAFEEGGKAARMDKPRSSNRYMPGSEPELYQAWNAGRLGIHGSDRYPRIERPSTQGNVSTHGNECV